MPKGKRKKPIVAKAEKAEAMKAKKAKKLKKVKEVVPPPVVSSVRVTARNWPFGATA